MYNYFSVYLSTRLVWCLICYQWSNNCTITVLYQHDISYHKLLIRITTRCYVHTFDPIYLLRLSVMYGWSNAGTMLVQCCYNVGTLLLQCCCNVSTMLVQCSYNTGTVVLQWWYNVVTMLVQCWHNVVTMLVQCWYNDVTMLVQCWYTVVIMLL